MKPIHIGSAQIDAPALQHQRLSDAGVRIISEQPTYGEFVRECYGWWMEGCLNCVACAVIDSYESNATGAYQFHWRMRLLYDLTNGKHGDGIELPRVQLQLFANLPMADQQLKERRMQRGFKKS